MKDLMLNVSYTELEKYTAKDWLFVNLRKILPKPLSIHMINHIDRHILSVQEVLSVIGS